MGLILDTSVLISAERQGQTAEDAVQTLARMFPGENFALSVITLLELNRGVHRGESAAIVRRRSAFVSDVESSFEIFAATATIAKLAAGIEVSMNKQGNSIALADLLIASTAIHSGRSLVTHNVRHFENVPGLRLAFAL